MTNTTTEILTVDGVVLNTLAKNVTTLAKTLTVASRRGAIVPVAGRHGGITGTRAYYSNNVLAWPMWVRGCTDDGLVPVGSTYRREFYKRVDELTRLFGKATGLLDIRHTLPDGTIRQAFGKVIQTIDFTTQGINPLGKFAVEIQMPDPFWQDLVAPADYTTVLAGLPFTATLATLQGGTAPIDDAIVTLIGPINSPRVTDVISGSWLQFTGNLTAAHGLAFNSDTWIVTGLGGQVVDYATITNGGSARFLEIHPNPVTGVYQVTVSGVLPGGGNASLTVSARRKYLVG